MAQEEKTFRFHWIGSKKTDEGKGKNVADAFTRLGFGAGAMEALDFYEEVK